MNVTLPLTSSRSPLWEGKLILPVVGEKCSPDPSNRSKHICHAVVEQGCSDKGRVTVAPPKQDPAVCLACAKKVGEAGNCTSVQEAQACTRPNIQYIPYERQPYKPGNVASASCSVEHLRRECFKPSKQPASLPTTMSACVTFRLAPRQKSDWVDVGKLIDTLNHASWNLPAGNYTLTLGLKEGPTGAITELGTFPSLGRPLQVLTDASTRASRRFRPRAADFWQLYGRLKGVQKKLKGKPPTHVPIFASTYQRDFPQGGLGPANGSGLPDPKYTAAQLDWEVMFGISPDDVNGAVRGALPSKGAWRTAWGYLDLRGYVRPRPGRETLEQKLQTYIDAGVGDQIRVIKLGDEIGLSRPTGNNTNAGFFAWVKARGLAPRDLGCAEFGAACSYNVSFALAATEPARYYYSHKYSNDFGIHSGDYKNATATIKRMLPNALAGANYGPTACGGGAGRSCKSYLPDTYKWVNAFRAGTFTLPFTEDYIFQQPPGSQQMFTLVVDVERAAVRPPLPRKAQGPLSVAAAALRRLPSSATKPGRAIMQYVMPHYPGNTPASWRRQLFGDIAHGVKYLHLYVLAPCFSSPAGDYSDGDGGMYEQILTAAHEVGQFDDILADSVPHAAGTKTALLFSETGDIFLDTYGTAGAAKRALYIALVHSQLAIDVLTEDDLVDGALESYAVLYVTHAYVNVAASVAVRQWVETGGTVVSSMGGGLRTEKNESNVAFSAMLGVSAFSIYAGTGKDVAAGGRIDYIKQDLAFAEVLDTAIAVNATQGDSGSRRMIVAGEKARFRAPADATVLARFGSDSTPAAFSRKVGLGRAFFFGLHLGLSYFQPAIPKRPVARGSRDECFNHWVPRDFHVGAREMLAAPALLVRGAAPVLSSEPRVDIGVLAAAGKGTVLPVTNWAGSPLKQLRLTLQFQCDYSTATLASGGLIRSQVLPTGLSVFTFDLAIADAIILRV